MLDRIELVRRLTPAYVLFGSVFCWQCSVCRKLFMAPTEAALRQQWFSEPMEIRSEFRTHDCRIQFRNALDRLERIG